MIKAWIDEYMHYLLIGLAVFTLLGISLLFYGLYSHEKAIWTAKEETAKINQLAEDNAATLKLLQKGIDIHEQKIAVIIASKGMTAEEIRKYFKTYEATHD